MSNRFQVCKWIVFVVALGLSTRLKGQIVEPSVSGFDQSLIQDEAARSAAAQILYWLELNVREMTYQVEDRVMFPDRPEIVMNDFICFRKPDLLYCRRVARQSPLPGQDGATDWTVCDGKTVWSYHQNAPGSENLVAQLWRNKGVAESEILKIVERHRRPQLSKIDFISFRDSGHTVSETIMGSGAFDPFTFCDPVSLKLTTDNDLVWEFTAQPAAQFLNANTQTVSLTFDKHQKTIRKMEFAPERHVLIFQNVRINPIPPLQDKLFNYSPPPNLPVTDITEDMLRPK